MENFSYKWEEWIVLLRQNSSERHCWQQKMNTFRFSHIEHLTQGLGRTAELQLKQADSSDAGTTGGHATRNRCLPPPGAHGITKCSLLLSQVILLGASLLYRDPVACWHQANFLFHWFYWENVPHLLFWVIKTKFYYICTNVICI